MRPSLRRFRVFPARQRGAIVIAAAVAMGVCVALMASADIGYLFYIKREFQKSADLAALAGAQLLPNTCVNAASVASTSALAQANLTAHSFSQAPVVAVSCGVFSSTGAAAPAGSAGGQYFIAGGTPSTVNGVQVLITGTAPALMPFIATRSIRASAVAVREQATAVVSTGSQLAALRLAGLNLSVLGPDGVARITLAGLLDRLGIRVDADIGVGELNSLLSVNNVSIGSLLTATAQALPSTGAALAAQVTLLNQSVQANATLSSASIKLGGANSPVSLFTSIGSSASQDSASLARAALHTELKVTDLISTALSIASSGNAVAVPNLTLAGIQLRSGIVSPPSVAAGPVGTTARQGQVRIALDIDTSAIPLVGPIADALKTRVHLPLFLDVTRGTARINAISCSSTPRTVDVLVNQTILGACVGKVDANVQFTSPGLCDAGSTDLQPEVLLKLLGTNLLTTSLRVDALSSTKVLAGMVAGETRSTPNDLPIGSTLGNIVPALAGVLSQLTAPPASGGGTPSEVATNTAALYLAQSKDAFGRYQIGTVISLLQSGKPGVLPALGSWNTNAAGNKFQIPYACGFLNLSTCYRDGTVWESFNSTVTGEGSGVLGGTLGVVLGGLVVDNCFGLVANLTNYNGCIAKNLASFLQTKPGGTVIPAAVGPCSTLLCTVLKPITDGLTPILDALGSALQTTLTSTLGLTLGQTSVTVQAISCGNVRIVY
jgi:uncharacterized membrane protein